MERNITMIALFAALIAALGLIPKLSLAFGVPITAQSLGIMLCGTILGARRGALAVLLFLLLVAMGLPLLAGGRGGLGLFVSPSVGYLIGFPIAAFVAGLVVERWRPTTQRPILVSATAGAIAGGVLALYVPGIAGMAVTLDISFQEATWLGLVFLPGDLLKAVLAGLITWQLSVWRPEIFRAEP